MSVFHLVLGDLIDINAARTPNDEALIDPDGSTSLTWAEWKARTLRFANSLIENGINRGDRIATFLRDAVELPTSFFSASKVAGIFVPINYRISPVELKYILEDCAAKVLIFDEDGREVVEKIMSKLKYIEMYIYTGKERLSYAKLFEQLIEEGKETNTERPVSEDDIAAILYTSGTTGKPKGTVHTHRGVLCATAAWTHPAKITPLDRSIALGPLYHIGPLLSNFMPTLYIGGSNVIQKHFDPTETLRLINDLGITIMWATPTHLNMLASVQNVKEFDISNLRAVQYSGAPLTLGLAHKVREIFGDINLINAYGMTECDAVSAAYPEEHDEHLGSIGRALPKTYIRVVAPGKGKPDAEVPRNEVGEIIVRSPCLMKEYWNLPDKTKVAIKDGWYFTSDLGKKDNDGYLYFAERKDDMIISGGENIYPLEVENFLSSHNKIQNVAVIGTPDEKWGSVVTAFVVKADKALTRQAIDEYCMKSDKLSRYKRPKRYVFVDELPTTSSGKVDKKLLRIQWETKWKIFAQRVERAD